MNNSDWNKERIREVFRHVVEFREKNNALIYLGEFSVPPWANGYEQWLKDCIDVFEELEFSYNYWNLNGWPIWNVQYVLMFRPNYHYKDISMY